MNPLGLSPALIKTIIDDPTILASPAKLGIPQAVADIILIEGYRKGFRTVFILNASLGALATIASIIMIKHNDLARGDEKPKVPDARTVTPAYSGTATPAASEKDMTISSSVEEEEEMDLEDTMVKAEVSNV